MESMTGRRCAVLSLMLAPALAAVFAAPATAAPTWLAPFDIAPADRSVEQVAASFGPSGSVVFAWGTTGGDGISAIAQARRAPGGAPVGAAALAAGASEPVLAAGADGTTYAAWAFSDPNRPGESGIVVARLNPDGSVGQQQVVSGGDNATTPKLSVAPDGTLGVAWLASSEEDTGSVRAAIGTFGAFLVREVSVGDRNASEPAADFDDGGTLHVAWSRLDSDQEGRIKVATVTKAGVVSGATLVSAAAADAGEPTVAAGPFGEAVAWAEVGADESGAVRFAQRVDAAYPPAQIAGGGGDGSGPHFAEAPGGALRLAWVSTDASDRGRALVAGVDAGVLSPAPASVAGADDVTEVRIAYAASGDGVAVWRREFNSDEPEVADIRAAGFDAAGPVLQDVSIPARARVGEPAAFSVRPVDLWSAVTGVTWLFGDGGQGAGAQASHTYDAPRQPANVTVRATDAVGNTTEATGQTDVETGTSAATPTPTPTPTGTPVPQPAPAALRLEGVASEFACIRYLGVKAPGRRAAFAFTLSETATVTVRIQKRTESKPRRTCPIVRPGGKPGTYTDAGTVTAPAGAGRGRVETGPAGELVAANASRVPTLRKKVRRGKATVTLKQLTGDTPLMPGTYIARISAQAPDGRTSSETRIKFWVLQGRS